MVHSKENDEHADSKENEIQQEPASILETFESQDEVQQLKDQLLRALAETDNVRKRAVRERESALQYAATHFARDLLPVADNLRRALDALPNATENNLSPELKAMIDGVILTEKALLSAFEKHGIQKITPMGEAFDHTYHQAMFEMETNDHPEGTIVEILQPGYIISNRLLRPAMVGVAKKAVSKPPHHAPLHKDEANLEDKGSFED